MRIGLVTDAACDLPLYFLNEHNVEILPINLHLGERRVYDVRDAQMAQGFYKSYMLDKDMPAETSQISVDEMVDFFKALIPKYDKVLCLTINRRSGKTHENAVEAAQIVNHYAQQLRGTRQMGGQAGQRAGEAFSIRVIDTQVTFTGQAIFVYEAVRILNAGMPYLDMVQHLQQLVHHVRSYLLPHDVYYMYTRANKRSRRSMSFAAYLLGKMFGMRPIMRTYMGRNGVVERVPGFEKALKKLFHQATQMIQHGLTVPVVAMSYAGNPKIIADMPMYQEFLSVANSHGVDVKLAIMCATGGINIGPGAFAMAYASGKL